MYFIVRASHWEIFGFLLSTLILYGLVDIFSGFVGLGPIFANIFYVIAVISYAGWILVTGTLLEIKRVRTLRTKPYKRFALAGIVLIALLLTPPGAIQHSEPWINTAIGLCLMALTFTSLFTVTGFVAKSLNVIETSENVSLKDYFFDLLRIIFWPIGIWSIQLRVNIIFGAIDTEHARRDKL